MAETALLGQVGIGYQRPIPKDQPAMKTHVKALVVGGGAVGSGLWSNVGRALAIVLGTVMALRHQRAANIKR